jgi:hypothetical protein
MQVWFRALFWFVLFWTLIFLLASHSALRSRLKVRSVASHSSASAPPGGAPGIPWQAQIWHSLPIQDSLANYLRNISDLWRKEQEMAYVGVIVFEKERRLLCTIPKAGCTSARAFGLKQTRGVWLDPLDPQEIHSIQPQSHANLTQIIQVRDEELLTMLSDPSWKFGVLVRHPLTRLLSGYLDKVQGGHEFSRFPLNFRYPQTFAQFVHLLEDAAKTLTPDLALFDEHWRPQSGFCLFRLLPREFFDYIAKVDEPESLRRFYVDMFGDSGKEWHEWTRSRSHAAGRKTLHARSADKELRNHVDEALALRVRRLYAEDYERFGYDLWPPTSYDT